jgi:bacteriorhodopsin
MSAITSATMALQEGSALIGDRPENIWLAIGTVLMLLGTFYFLVRGWGVEDPEAQEYYIITILIPGIATAAYFSMFAGFGLTEVTLTNLDGQVLANQAGADANGVLDIYWARYADWLFTTPLLLLDLGLLANASRNEIGALIGLDAFMIITGLVGALETVQTFRYTWWFISTVALLFILYYLFSVLTTRAEQLDEDTKSTFIVLRNLVLVLWSIYPILWIIGTEGAGVVGLYVETLLFMILDVTAKVGFGFILLRSRAVMGDTSAPTPSAEGEGATAD